MSSEGRAEYAGAVDDLRVNERQVEFGNFTTISRLAWHVTEMTSAQHFFGSSFSN